MSSGQSLMINTCNPENKCQVSPRSHFCNPSNLINASLFNLRKLCSVIVPKWLGPNSFSADIVFNVSS
uniref:Uncharacterized protein n=1 Tax=Arundo donax TaxID=35708 RepID=A0A0A9DEU4_ARUDO